jgi:hypothetical protein
MDSKGWHRVCFYDVLTNHKQRGGNMIRILAIVIGAGLFLSAGAGEGPCNELRENERTGGAGGIEFGITNLDLQPLKEVVDRELSGKGFDFEREPFFTMGALGYAGQRRNGPRIGLGGWAGYRSFFSDEYSGTADSAYMAQTGDSTIDSVLQLHVVFAHLGILAEKSFLIGENLNLYTGGMIGAGIVAAVKDGQLSQSAFTTMGPADTIDLDEETRGTSGTAAPVWVFDVRGGATYSFTRWLHVGLDASVLMQYSSRGYGYHYGSFFTANPSLRARFIFGNAA